MSDEIETTCESTNREGKVCGRPCIPGKSVCKFHTEEYRIRKQIAGRQGGRGKKKHGKPYLTKPEKQDDLSALLKSVKKDKSQPTLIDAAKIALREFMACFLPQDRARFLSLAITALSKLTEVGSLSRDEIRKIIEEGMDSAPPPPITPLPDAEKVEEAV